MSTPNIRGILAGVHKHGFIYGWIDLAGSQESPKVYIYIEHEFMGVAETQTYPAQEGYQNLVSFSLLPEIYSLENIKDGCGIEAYFDLQKTLPLENSPLKLDESALRDLVEPAYARLVGFLDNIRADGTIYGWAFDPHYPENTLPIYLYADDLPLGRISALFFREDLQHAGIADGWHAFGLPLDFRPRVLARLQAGMKLHAYFDADRRYELTHSPVVLSQEILEPLRASVNPDWLDPGAVSEENHPRHALEDLDKTIKLLIKKGDFRQAFQRIYRGFEAETNISFFYEQWYFMMVKVATAAYKAGEYRPSTILFRSRRGGLCNRLHGLAVAYGFSVAMGFPLKVCWSACKHCPITWDELSELMDLSFLATTDEAEILDGFEQEAGDSVWAGEFYIDHLVYKLLSPTPEQEARISEISRQFIQSLRFSRPIMARVQEFMVSQRWDDRVVGVHVRRTDHTTFYTAGGLIREISSDEAFRARINELLAQGYHRFFLATDSMATFEKFHDEFGGKVFTRIKHFNTRQFRQTSMEDALIDLVLLSKTDIIVGSRLSTFSEFASKLNHARLILA